MFLIRKRVCAYMPICARQGYEDWVIDHTKSIAIPKCLEFLPRFPHNVKLTGFFHAMRAVLFSVLIFQKFLRINWVGSSSELDPSTIRFHDLDLRGIIKYALGSRVIIILNKRSRLCGIWFRTPGQRIGMIWPTTMGFESLSYSFNRAKIF